jgi:oligopeptidase B
MTTPDRPRGDAARRPIVRATTTPDEHHPRDDDAAAGSRMGAAGEAGRCRGECWRRTGRFTQGACDAAHVAGGSRGRAHRRRQWAIESWYCVVMKRLALIVAVVGCGSTASTPPASPPPPPVASAPAPAPAPPAATEPAPPSAARKPYTVKSPNGDREDPYYWLRDDTRKQPEMLAYLNAENAYASAILGPAKPLEDKLVAELRSHVAPDVASVPELSDGYWYLRRYTAGQEHPVLVRHKTRLTAPEEVILDCNELARGKPFYALGNAVVSRNGRYLAWTDDTVGRLQFVLHIKDLTTGKVLPDTASNVHADRPPEEGIAWANDNKTLFYVGKDATTLREDRVFRHELGAASDQQIFLEPDGQYYVHVSTTKSHRYVQIVLSATTNTEVRLLDADKPRAPDRVVLPREVDHLYSLDHLDGRFVIRSNAGAKNYRLISVPEAKVRDRKAWRDLIPASTDVFVDQQFTVARSFVAATVRKGGLSRVQVLPANGPAFLVEADEPAFRMTVDDLPDPTTARLRYVYTSPVTPPSVIELDLATRAKTTLQVLPVPGYDASQYVTEYLDAKASDGVAVPISVVHRKDTKLDGSAPLLVYGYGSYGFSIDPAFDASRLPLLDRGWVYAVAHIRGGQELGRAWYDDGKLMKKRNTFTDFIAATEHLVAHKYGARDQVFAEGRSAGGLLMGAILNLRPDLYRGVIAGVPFVDVVTTMLDESIPLTTNEFDEWGNPKEKAAYDYMLGYSPYDNVKAQAYPSIYVHTGLWDSQVQYFEPAKWVAKLRATKTDHNPIVFDIDMAAGHGGKSGRFDRLKDVARDWTFLLTTRERPDRR